MITAEEILAEYDRYPELPGVAVETEEPVDSYFALFQQRLLLDQLIGNWTSPSGLPYLALANVGLFYERKVPPVVPDVMLSLDLPRLPDLQTGKVRSYFAYVFKKLPEVVIELVSEETNGEDGDGGHKRALYERIGIRHYIVYDPYKELGDDPLRVYELHRRRYRRTDQHYFADVGLGVRTWVGEYNGCTMDWLRWCDARGKLLPTSGELLEAVKKKLAASRGKTAVAIREADLQNRRVETERRKAAIQKRKAELEQQKAEDERRKAEAAAEKIRQLEDRLRAAGLEP